MTPPGNVDALLANAPWVRGLALQLCRDVHRAEDAAQEACLAAARQPPHESRSLRAYLARILRNVLHRDARSGLRRTQRERAVAVQRDDAAADTVELVARAELHAALFAAVLRLPDAQREVVLLHYFEGIDLAGVAVRVRRSADAVRAMLRRARAQLRTDLERRGGRPSALLAPLGNSLPSPSWTALGAIAMQGKVLAAAAAVVVLGLCVLPFTGLGAADPPLGAPASANAASDPRGPQPAPTLAAEPMRAPASAAAEVPVRVLASPPEQAVAGRLVGCDPRIPWTTPLTATASRQGAHEVTVAVGADGRFRFTLPAWNDASSSQRVRFRADDPWYASLDATVDLPDRPDAGGDIELVVTPRPVVLGRAANRAGAWIAGAQVRCWPTAVGVPRSESLGAQRAGDDGRFAFVLPAAGEVLLGVLPPEGREDLVAAAVAVDVRGVTDLGDVVLPTASAVTGTVRWSDGQPVADAEVGWRVRSAVVLDKDADLAWLDGRIVHQRRTATTDASGAFTLPVAEGEAGTILVHRAAGCLPAEFTTTRATAPQQVELTVPGHPVTIRVLHDGQPAGRAGVQWSREHFAGNYGTDERGVLRQLVLDEPLRLRAVSLGGDRASEWVEFAQGVPDEVVLQLLPIEGERVVLRVEGAALTTLTFAWRPHTDAAASRTATLMPIDGAYVMRVPPGLQRLRVLGSEGQPSQYLLPTELDVMVPPPGEVVVPVRLGGRVRLAATDERGAFLSGTYRLLRDGVAVGPGRWKRPGGATPTTATLPAGGEHDTEVYESGPYELDLDLGARGTVRRRIEIPSGATVPLRIVVP